MASRNTPRPASLY
ncbi:unnamed protein product [Staurois parvus]|uniref:Uncharacterized protein n=1 Tax=Staurois parvus TaxID=386267 RepID=A0ABN9H4B7_9NEOB|nr:unnamed protein product [Staurois parvus]